VLTRNVAILIDNLIAADGRPTLCNSAVEMIEFGAIYFTSVCTCIVSESEGKAASDVHQAVLRTVHVFHTNV